MTRKIPKTMAFAAVVLSVGTVSAFAATSPPLTGVTKNAVNGVNRAAGVNGALKANAVGNRQIKFGSISCGKLNAALAAVFCNGGFIGAKGATGATGPAGPQGAKGDTGATGPAGPKGATGAQGQQGIPGTAAAKGEKGDTGSQGPQGLTGPIGVPGPQGPKGDVGATGPKGDKGDIGNTGSAGAPGAAGAAGPKGDTGSVGPKGDTGALGAPGAPGAPGANAPGVVVTHVTGGDSSICGGDWATDTYTRTLQIVPQDDGTIQVVRYYQGTFVTIMGVPQPNGTCPGTLQTGGVTGTFTGFDVVVVTGGNYDPTATCAANCTTAAMVTAFFPGGTPSVNNGWEYHYTTSANGTWTNASSVRGGNVGNIIG